MSRLNWYHVLCFCILTVSACTATTGTKVTAADAREFVEKVATRQQVRAKFGEPDASNTTDTGACDTYLAGSSNAFSGATETSQAMFCYDNNGVLAKKSMYGTQTK